MNHIIINIFVIIVFSIIYFIFVWPLGFVLRLCIDPLRLRKTKTLTSYLVNAAKTHSHRSYCHAKKNSQS